MPFVFCFDTCMQGWEAFFLALFAWTILIGTPSFIITGLIFGANKGVLIAVVIVLLYTLYKGFTTQFIEFSGTSNKKLRC